MLNRKGGLSGATSVGYSRASNDSGPFFQRRVSAFNEDLGKRASDEPPSPDWGSPDASLRCGGAGNTISWSSDNLHLMPRESCGASFTMLDSPKSSYVGSPTRCTGGGHGEAGPSSSGSMRLSCGSDPASLPQSLISPTRKSTPLARHIAERALMSRSTRRSVDCQGALRTRESAPLQSSSALQNAAAMVPGNAISSPSCATYEKLPSFIRFSTPTLSSVPEPPASCGPTRLPEGHSPHSPFHSPSPSGTSILAPWMPSPKDGSTPISINTINTPTAPGRVLTPASPTTPAGSGRPTRHMLMGTRTPRPPSSMPPSANSDSYLDVNAGGGRPKPGGGGGGGGGGGSGGSSAVGMTVGSAARRTSSPPPFQPRQTPSCGLIHLWSGAPAGMRRGEWSMTQYTIARQLYGGYASSVFKARCLRSSQDVVLKVYTLSSLSDFLRNQVLRELDIHARLEHPGVVQLLAAFREGDKLVLVLEYVRGGSLDRARRKLGGRMSEQQALELVMLPLLRTLHYLHSKSIVHRDIKPENILFTQDWKLKVCDYGVSICLLEERAVTRTGSRDYMAPEVQVCPLKRAPDDNKTNAQMAYGGAADIWSLGVLTYELLVGFTPFPGGPPPPLDEKLQSVRSLAFPSCISADARSFVLSCLLDAPGDRPTIYELLKHRWMQSAMA